LLHLVPVILHPGELLLRHALIDAPEVHKLLSSPIRVGRGHLSGLHLPCPFTFVKLSLEIRALPKSVQIAFLSRLEHACALELTGLTCLGCLKHPVSFVLVCGRVYLSGEILKTLPIHSCRLTLRESVA
jgi:hypothetical protein